MRVFLVLGLLMFQLYASSAHAGVAEARESARMNNCNPKKIEVISNNLNASSQTIYRVECNMPKVRADGVPDAAQAVLIRCDGAICERLRALPQQTK